MRRTMSWLLASTLASASWSASPSFHQAVLDDDPVVVYHLGEVAGNALNTGTAGPTLDAQYLGAFLDRRGVATLAGDGGVWIESQTDYLQSIAEAPAGLLGNPSFSIEVVFWLRPDGAVIQYPPMVHWGPTGANPTGTSVFFGFRANQQDQLFLGFYNGGLRTPAGTLAPGQWYHAVWVRVGGGNASTGSTLYLNGVDITSMLVPDDLLSGNAGIPAVGATEIRLARARDLEGTRAFHGILDEVAIFDRPLTPTEVLAHFEALGWIFLDGFESGDAGTWSAAVP